MPTTWNGSAPPSGSRPGSCSFRPAKPSAGCSTTKFHRADTILTSSGAGTRTLNLAVRDISTALKSATRPDDDAILMDTDGIVRQHLDLLVWQGRRPGTIRQRAWFLGRLGRHLAPVGLLDATETQVAAFLGRGVAPETRAAEYTHARGFYRWALRDGLIVEDPTFRLTRPRRPRRVPRPIPDRLLAHAIDTASAPVDAWLALAAFAGLRRCEIAPLRGEDWDRDARLLVIREQKGGDEGTVSVARRLEPILERLPDRGWWFPRRDNLGPVSAVVLGQQANRHLRAVAPGWTLHSLRHWHGTQALRATGNLRVVQEMMRHRSPVATAWYTAVTGLERLAAVDALPDVCLASRGVLVGVGG